MNNGGLIKVLLQNLPEGTKKYFNEYSLCHA